MVRLEKFPSVVLSKADNSSERAKICFVKASSSAELAASSFSSRAMSLSPRVVREPCKSFKVCALALAVS